MRYQHPFRAAELHTFKRRDHKTGGVQWIARFHPYDTYPMFWHGETEEAAVGAAEAFRAEAIAKNEANYIAKQKALEKARAAKAAKAEGRA